MERKPRARIMKAKALTSPEPEFVSQVRAGANQEPQRVVKMDISTVEEIVALFEAKEINMKDAVKKAKAAGLDIAQLVFRGGDFPDRASVDAWLKEGGYEGYEVTEKQDGDVTEFTVSSTTTSFKTGSMRKIKGQADGLTVFVGEIEGTEQVAEKTAEEQAVEDASVKPSAITSAKGDHEADVEAGTEAAAVEATEAAKTEAVAEQPKVEEAVKTEGLSAIAANLDKVAATVAKTEEPTSAQKADTLIAELRTKGMYEVSSLGSILRELRWMVTDADYNDLSDEAVSLIKTAANALIDALVGVANDAIGDMVEVFKADALKADATVTTDATQATKSEEATTEVVEEATKVEASKTDPALLDILGKLSTVVVDLSAKVDAVQKELTEVKTTTAAKADEEASKGQTRKGADVVQPAATTEDDETKKKQDVQQDHAQRRLRSAFGSYKGNGFGL